MRGLLSLLVAALFVAVPGTVAADSGATTLDAAQESSVAAFTLNAGDVVDYQYSSYAVEFRIELEGFGTVFSSAGQATAGSFVAPQNGRYTFSFRNTGSYTTVVSWNVSPRTPPINLILVGGVAAVVLAAVVGVALWRVKRPRLTTRPPAPQAPPPP